jgi:hypothetical protein
MTGERTAEPLLGTWEIVTFTSRQADGRAGEPWGPHPAGRIVYDTDGHVTALLMHERHNEADGSRSPPEASACLQRCQLLTRAVQHGFQFMPSAGRATDVA